MYYNMGKVNKNNKEYMIITLDAIIILNIND